MTCNRETIQLPVQIRKGDLEDKPGKAARNERRKLTATYINNIALALFVTGVAAPYFQYMHTPPEETVRYWSLGFGAPGGPRVTYIVAFIGAIAVSICLHILARQWLWDLED